MCKIFHVINLFFILLNHNTATGWFKDPLKIQQRDLFECVWMRICHNTLIVDTIHVQILNKIPIKMNSCIVNNYYLLSIERQPSTSIKLSKIQYSIILSNCPCMSVILYIFEGITIQHLMYNSICINAWRIVLMLFYSRIYKNNCIINWWLMFSLYLNTAYNSIYEIDNVKTSLYLCYRSCFPTNLW